MISLPNLCEDAHPDVNLYLSLHDALPILDLCQCQKYTGRGELHRRTGEPPLRDKQRKGKMVIRSEEHSLNSSHVSISYAVFCLKKKMIYDRCGEHNCDYQCCC